MALIQCPECGSHISDKATACPHCGVPLVRVVQMPPQPTYVQYVNPAQPYVNPQVAPQQVIYTTAPVATQPVATQPVATPTPQVVTPQTTKEESTVEMIYPFGATKKIFHISCMKQLMRCGEVDVFEKIENMKVVQKYVWVREFGKDGEYDYYPMSKYGEQLFCDLFGTEIMRGNILQQMLPKGEMVPYQSSYIEGKELVAREYSTAETRQLYTQHIESLGLDSTENYYCLPIYEESFDYCGKHYTFRGIGNSTISKFCWNDLPTSAFLEQGPEYSHIRPLHSAGTIIGIVAALVSFIALWYVAGFWLTLLITIITVGICFFMGSMLVEPFVKGLNNIDKHIRDRINTRRREEFRTQYEAIQQRKQADAKYYLGLELSYEVPEYPIP